jgi:hypothetical protein
MLKNKIIFAHDCFVTKSDWIYLLNSYISYMYLFSQIYLRVDLTFNGWSDIREDGEEPDSTGISWASTETIWNYDWITKDEL